VGGVQAGKTGLMGHLAAMALDSGYSVILVLAGLKDDLRTQTALRFSRDLLQRGDPVVGATGQFTHPAGLGYHGVRKDCWAPRYDEDVNHDEAFLQLFESNARRSRKILAVAKKQVTSLTKLRDALDSIAHLKSAQPMRVLVLDDECDEASVSGDPEAPTPERIAEVWRSFPGITSYIGLTATPAANLLQDTTSPLFPAAFVLHMRSPGGRETNTSYFEPDFNRRYTGGHAYYDLLEGFQRSNFLLQTGMSDAEFQGTPGHDTELASALIAFFVSGGTRLLEHSRAAAQGSCFPPPHTMMLHADSGIDAHWGLCERVVALTRAQAGRLGPIRENLRATGPGSRLRPADLQAWLASHEAAWQGWYASFRKSREDLRQLFPDRPWCEFPTWEETKATLPQVFNAVRLRVVNSDATTSDPPLQFDPAYSADGASQPLDNCAIIIGGNRLSRGLTIAGLCISYYTRVSNRFLEDTTLQRSRWFGYRNQHLEFCRLFTHGSLAVHLQSFHQHDEDLRSQLAWNIRNGRPPCDATYRFLTTYDSVPTAKMGRGLGPDVIEAAGTKPFVEHVQMGDSPLERATAFANQEHAFEIAKRVIADGDEIIARDSRNSSLGAVIRQVPAAEISSLLDGFAYTFHNPDPTRGIGWNLRDHYRAPRTGIPVTLPRMPPRSDPFLIAAYLKYWDKAFQTVESDPSCRSYFGPDGVTRWRPCPAPRFNLAIRYGSLQVHPDSAFTFPLLNRAVDDSGTVGSRWGGHGYSSFGDEWIDLVPPGDPEAPRGADFPGLCLLHVIARDAKGVSGSGKTYAFDRPCIGLVIPVGGPSMRSVLAIGRT
jgi:hypothetical protein